MYRFLEVGLFLGKLFIEVTDLADCLFVSNSEIFDQATHVIDFFLQILVVGLNKKNFFFFSKLFFDQKFFTLTLLLNLKLHFSKMSNLLKLVLRDLTMFSSSLLGLNTAGKPGLQIF